MEAWQPRMHCQPVALPGIGPWLPVQETRLRSTGPKARLQGARRQRHPTVPGPEPPVRRQTAVPGAEARLHRNPAVPGPEARLHQHLRRHFRLDHVASQSHCLGAVSASAFAQATPCW